MANRKQFWRILTERGPLTALSVAGAILVGIAAPASAQFFNFGGPPPPPRGGFYSPFGDVFPGAPQAPRAADYSHAPAPAKRDTPAERNILVLGDSMSDWLGYGLEDAFSESPEFGVVRKSKTISGLIKYQPKGDPADWAGAAKQIIVNEKPDVIVVMLGIHDRIPIREPVVEKKADAKPATEPGKKAGKKDVRKDGETKSGDTKSGDAKPSDAKSGDAAGNTPDDEAALDDKPKTSGKSEAADAEAAPDDDDQSAPAQQAQRPGNGVYDFREDRWVELYTKKIAELIAVLKTKNVPILWVGLPALKGTKSTSDMLFLDSLYRDGAGKAGITYVDIWDGFVDEQGRYIQQGPDFEGQIRRLRSYDGVYFTKAGARKLALFTEREIRRVLGSRATPVALPSETQSPTPDASNVRPGVVGPRPLAGPVVPLVASAIGTDELLGGNGSRPTSVDALAARTLIKGEALSAPAGRADDFSWPRRDIGSLTAPGGDAGVAALAPDAAAPPQQKRKRPPRPQDQGFFGFDAGRGWPTRQRFVPRAEAPGFFTR